MASVTFEIPDKLAEYAVEQGVLNPEWFAKIMRTALGRLNPALADKRKYAAEKQELARNHAAWKKFMTELDKLPPLPGDDLPPKLNLTRELPL